MKHLVVLLGILIIGVTGSAFAEPGDLQFLVTEASCNGSCADPDDTDDCSICCTNDGNGSGSCKDECLACCDGFIGQKLANCEGYCETENNPNRTKRFWDIADLFDAMEP